MAYGHDDPVAVARRAALEHPRQLRVDDQRVVAADFERAPEPLEDRPPVVVDLDRLSMHGFPHHHLSSPRLNQGLMAQARAESGDLSRGATADAPAPRRTRRG